MAQRESLGGLVIAGVTDVDPGMSPPRLTASILGTQGRMTTLNAIGRAGGASAQLAAAAAMLAKDSIIGAFGDRANPEDVGRCSQAAIAMSGRLAAAGPDGSTAGGDARRAEEQPIDEPT